jgi:hypothetical protein
MSKERVSDAVGLPRLLGDGGSLSQLHGHCERIAADIRHAAEETGGDAWRSPRYKDAKAIVEQVGNLQAIASGVFKHADDSPQAIDQTDDVLRAVAAERKKQRRKGYDAKHDNGHTDGEIAVQAGYVLSGAQFTIGEPAWIDMTGQPRRQSLIQAIALAVAEVERIDRVAERTAIADIMVLDADR